MAAQKKGSKPAPKQTAAKKKPAQKPAQAAKKNTKQQKPQSKPPQSNSMTAVRERDASGLTYFSFSAYLNCLSRSWKGTACGNGSMS